jgi:uncharacterized protein
MAGRRERSLRRQPARQPAVQPPSEANSDLAIDFHTGTTGLEVAAFNIGDRNIPDVKTMTDLFPIGLMWDNPAYLGVLHNAFVDAGISCFTPEIGAAQ